MSLLWGRGILLFLTTPQNLVETSPSIGLLGQHGQQTKGKATLWESTSSIGHKFGSHSDPVRKLFSCGLSSIRQLRSTNRGPVSRPHRTRLYPPSNALFDSQTQAHKLSTSLGIASKPEEFGGRALASCMKFFGVNTSNYDSFIENMLSSRKNILRKFVKKIKIWYYIFMALPFEIFGLSTIARCLIKNNWLAPKVKYLICDDLIVYAKTSWGRVSSMLRLE